MRDPNVTRIKGGDVLVFRDGSGSPDDDRDRRQAALRREFEGLGVTVILLPQGVELAELFRSSQATVTDEAQDTATATLAAYGKFNAAYSKLK